jgi:hypothetical protein
MDDCKKIEFVLGESQFGFRRGKGNRPSAAILCLRHRLEEGI